MRILLFFVIALCISCSPQTIEIGSGVSKTLADQRKSNISSLSYQLSFNIPKLQSESIVSNVVIAFELENIEDIYIDFKEDSDHLRKITVNEQTIEIIHKNEHILIPSEHLNTKNRIEIGFIAGDLSLNRNEDYLYTLFVPARARTTFPLFDQPNLKAKYQLNLEIPKDWEAVTNAVISEEIETEKSRKLTYKETKPISSYLFAFAVGAFQKLDNPSGTMTMYYRESDQEKVNRNAEAVFNLHESSLQWLEDYTEISYPFQKFDFALIPTFQYGGMEHPGSIFYRESALFLNDSPSINQQLRRASLIAHETAHMWFGDLVTMDWFNDVWLKEVFANFYAAKIVNPNFPEVNHDLRFLLSHYPSAYAVDRSKGSHAIQQNLDNLADAGSMYGPIIYQKAPIVMRNLEQFLGKTTFQEGIKEYLQAFEFGNATWDDLINIMSSKTELDLQQWNNDWIKSSGMPHIAFDSVGSRLVNGTKSRIWTQEILMNEDSFPNTDGRTYGYLELSEDQLEKQLIGINEKDELFRASVWVNQWEAVLNVKKHPIELYGKLIESIEIETNPLILNYQFSILNEIFWNFLSPAQRQDKVAETEQVIFDKMTTSANISVQRICYNNYTSIGTSDAALQNLRMIWEDKLQGFELSLSENDLTTLAYELYLKSSKKNQDILELQYEKLKNEDNRKRMSFVRPALSSETTVRDSVFNSLLNADNRAQEPWVGDVLKYLHHPLRRAQSVKYLKESLEIIEEIKNTGDIFFPSRWLGASFASHNSEEAKTLVDSFLATHPSLPKDLENKILQATDMLERRIQSR